ncbi:WAT1-related protein [Acorus calamus]|uniref:WAT1-related protein n=1 Tax=Acorus calamus TaxID=4465 RepID=A0AAV9D7D9_ACOCL|nr:WAT1-related protein [Acorus calamus]
MRCFWDWMPIIGMVAASVGYATVNVLIKKAIDVGINHLVLITYRHCIAAVFLTPIAYFREKKTRTKVTAAVFWQIFLSALLGATLSQYFFFIGMQYTTATFSCAFLNIAPVVTFMVALLFGLETLNMKSTAGKAKVLGMIVSAAGAMVLTFYKGVALTSTSHQGPSTAHAAPPESMIDHHHQTVKWTLGSLALFAGCFCWSTWFVVQSKVSKNYPSVYSGTAITFFLVILQSASLCFVTRRDTSLWVLKGKLELVTVTYAGLVGSALGFLIMSWCVRQRGPVFTSSFCPLIQIFVAVIEYAFLDEQLHLGSVLGSVIVIVGLYFLLWGKGREVKVCEIKDGQGNSREDGPRMEQV